MAARLHVEGDYERDGVVCVRQAFSADWLARIEAGLLEVFECPGPMSFCESAPEGRKTYVSDLFSWTSNPTLRSFVFDSPAADMAARLLDVRGVNLLYDQCFLREHGSERSTEWHNDKSYWPVSGERLCSLWLPLAQSSLADGGLEYVAGSHRHGRMYKDHFFHLFRELDLAERDPGSGFLEATPDIDSVRNELTIISFELEPGDCLVHHPLVLHAASRVRTGRRRFAYSTHWAGSDVRYAPRVDTQRMLHDPEIAPGEHLTGELFPWVRRRGGSEVP